MEKVNYEEIRSTVREQEEELLFDSFSNEDALKLGTFITNRVYSKRISLAVCIRRMNGAVVYQHLTQGTDMINQNWMDRKFNTVTYFGHSSLYTWADAQITGEDLEFNGLSSEDFVFIGGAFPIRLKTGELVAVAIVSNLPHLEDHKFLVGCLKDYLQQV